MNFNKEPGYVYILTGLTYGKQLTVIQSRQTED